MDSKVTVGIIASRTKYKATCTATSSELLSCITDDNNLPEQPHMDSVRTEGTSAKWKHYESLQLNVRYVSKYVYDTYLGRFKFNVTIANEGIPLNTLTRIPTHYGTNVESSSCILIESKKFDCTVIHEPQRSTDSFDIPKTGAGEATFIDYVYKNVKFADHLFFKKAYNLKFKDNKWKFDILLSESNLKDQQALTIDVLVDETASTANCNLNSNILSCEVNAGNQKLENIIKIKNNEENFSQHRPANGLTGAASPADSELPNGMPSGRRKALRH